MVKERPSLAIAVICDTFGFYLAAISPQIRLDERENIGDLSAAKLETLGGAAYCESSEMGTLIRQKKKCNVALTRPTVKCEKTGSGFFF